MLSVLGVDFSGNWHLKSTSETYHLQRVIAESGRTIHLDLYGQRYAVPNLEEFSSTICALPTGTALFIPAYDEGQPGKHIVAHMLKHGVEQRVQEELAEIFRIFKSDVGEAVKLVLVDKGYRDLAQTMAVKFGMARSVVQSR